MLVDKSLVDMLDEARPREHMPNHGSANLFGGDIKAFLDKERGLDAMLGPFKKAPFEDWARYNPMMSRPNRDSAARRVILRPILSGGSQCQLMYSSW